MVVQSYLNSLCKSQNGNFVSQRCFRGDHWAKPWWFVVNVCIYIYIWWYVSSFTVKEGLYKVIIRFITTPMSQPGFNGISQRFWLLVLVSPLFFVWNFSAPPKKIGGRSCRNDLFWGIIGLGWAAKTKPPTSFTFFCPNIEQNKLKFVPQQAQENVQSIIIITKLFDTKIRIST